MLKLVTLGLGVSTLILAVMVMRGRKRMGPMGSVTTGEVRPDTRGAQDLAAKQIVLGPKAVAEAAKAGDLGPLKAEAREIHKRQRAA